MKKFFALLLVCSLFNVTFPARTTSSSSNDNKKGKVRRFFAKLKKRKNKNVIGKERLPKGQDSGRAIKVTENGLKCDGITHSWRDIESVLIFDYQGAEPYQLLVLRQTANDQEDSSEEEALLAEVPRDTVFLMKPPQLMGAEITDKFSEFINFELLPVKLLNIVDWEQAKNSIIGQGDTENAVDLRVFNVYESMLAIGYGVVELLLPGEDGNRLYVRRSSLQEGSTSSDSESLTQEEELLGIIGLQIKRYMGRTQR